MARIQKQSADIVYANDVDNTTVVESNGSLHITINDLDVICGHSKTSGNPMTAKFQAKLPSGHRINLNVNAPK